MRSVAIVFHSSIQCTCLFAFPPLNRGKFNYSTDVEVYAPYEGLVVEAGPDSLTGTEEFVGPYEAFPGWVKEACPQTNQGTCFPVPGSYFVWFYPLNTGEWKAMVALRHDTDASNSTGPDEAINSSGDVLSPVDHVALDTFVQNVKPGGLEYVCPAQGGGRRQFGCSEGPGRQLVIWHEANDGDLAPDIQTSYVHVDMNQYDTWQSQCSVGQNYQQRREIWDALYNVPTSPCWVRLTPTRTHIGTARRIGFTGGVHLHYAVYVDRGDIDDGDVFKRDLEEIDPSIAVDFHMHPGRGGSD